MTRTTASDPPRSRVIIGMDSLDKTEIRQRRDTSGIRVIADFAAMLVIAIIATLATIALIS
jgi:hypothetical protein